MNYFHVMFHFRRKFLGESKVCGGNDTIHGGPDFVAHVGQKLALGLGRGLGSLLGLF